ncbi:hypothetical protein ACFVAJ_19350 [Agromyces sp. NPDC057679]|uniref:hypothetical protein n=1 Tax=Agromyces sp. NPDC057679 TaxID=3346207 RepID=UPI00366E247C
MSVPLPIFGPMQDGDLDLLKAAKQSLDLSFLVRPVDATNEVPGRLRVLALRSRPGYPCDNVLVADPTDASALRSALEWTLRQRENHHLAMTSDEMLLPILQSVFGSSVREIFEEPPAPVQSATKSRKKPEPAKFEGWLTGADMFS